MKIYTKRLAITALSDEELARLCVNGRVCDAIPELEADENAADEHLLAAYNEMYRQCLLHPNERLWHTNWQIILPAENKAVGSIGFLGAPDESGETEIGYGTDEKYRGRGIASEALCAMCEWAFSHGVSRLVAETEPDNNASVTVLRKCGFVLDGKRDENLLFSLCASDEMTKVNSREE